MPIIIKREDNKRLPVQSGAPKKGGKNTDKYRRIMGMPAEDREAINALFLDGKSVSEIAGTLRAMGHFTDVKDSSLSQYLYRYKWDVIEKNIVLRAEELNEKKRAKVLAQAVQEIDVIKEVAELVYAQKARVGKLMAREQNMPMLFNSLGGEMKTLAGFVQQYAELSFDLGHLKRVPKVTKVSQDGADTIIESDAKEALTLSVKQTQKLEKAALRFYEALEGVDSSGAQSL